MFSFFGFGKSKLKEAIKNGAVIIDVRTPHEFDQGQVPGSINIPVDRISISIERIKAIKKPVIVCCASGMRSGTAKQILNKAGIQNVLNGDSWENVLKIYKQI
jgi:rhodanese-related sulfurtransferase